MGVQFVYCLFCETSYENKAEIFLKGLGYSTISALVERKTVKNGKHIREYRSIIPGYVFFENNAEPDWTEICKYKHIYYPLQYLNGQKHLKDNDLHFINWLKGNNGEIAISKAKAIGTKIQFLDGALLELEDNIVKINKKQKCAGIKIEGDGIKNIIWLSYELQ